MLEITGLCKAYGDVVALDGVDLRVGRGQVVALLGPNGAGKSTLVSIVAGLRHPDGGAIRVDGVDALASPRQARALIGLAPQELGVVPVVTVRQNLQLFGRLAGLGGSQLRRRVADVARSLLVEDLLDRPAGELSGGQKRRVHTAIAMLHRPPVLLLDEPTAGADVVTRRQLLTVVRGLVADGAAVLYSTHYLPEVDALGASVVLLDRGRVMASGTIEELVARYGHLAPSGQADLEGVFLSLTGRSIAADGGERRDLAS